MNSEGPQLSMDDKHPNVTYHQADLSHKEDEYLGASLNRAVDSEKAKFTYMTAKDVSKRDQHGIPGFMKQRKRNLLIITEQKTSIGNKLQQENIGKEVQYRSVSGMDETKFQLDDRDYHEKPLPQPIVCSWDQKAIFNQLRNQTK